MTTRQLRIVFKDKKLFISTFLMLIGSVVLCLYLSRDKVNMKSDLVEMNVILNSYQFNRYGLRNDHYCYNLYLGNYRNRFQIIADIIDCFNKKAFEKNIKTGDTLRVFISRNDYINLRNLGKVKLFGIYEKDTTYLDSECTIEKYNSNFPVVLCLIFIIGGGLIFYFHKDKLKLKRN